MVDVDLGSRDDDTREAETFFAKVTEVREALRGFEHGDDVARSMRGIDDR